MLLDVHFVKLNGRLQEFRLLAKSLNQPVFNYVYSHHKQTHPEILLGKDMPFTG
jgi:hypothetical protein